MILFAILAIILVIIVVVAIAALCAGGAGMIIVFADLIVCAAIIVWIMTRLIKRRNR